MPSIKIHYEVAKLLQSCLTLCNPMDCSPPGSSVYGILQTRILEWVTISSSCVFIIYDLFILRCIHSFYNLFIEKFYPKCITNLSNAFYDSELVMSFLLLILLMWWLMLIDLQIWNHFSSLEYVFLIMVYYPLNVLNLVW